MSPFLIILVIFSIHSVQSGPPVFKSTYETIVINEGSKASVLCIATNDSPITYKWYNKQFGEEVSNKGDSVVSTSEAPEGSHLVFNPVSSSHEGIYTCNAENEHGLVSKTYQITVHSENNALLLDVSNVTDTSVEISVRNFNPDLTYEVIYSEKVKSDNISFTFKDSSFVLNDLIPSGLYTFHVRALESDGGVVKSESEPTEVVLLPYVPEMVLRSLTKNSLTIGWSSKWDDFSRDTIDGYSLQYGSVQRKSYDQWEPSRCVANIELPKNCFSQYTISDLYKDAYYEIRLRAHTKAGYGKPAYTKIFIT